MFHRFQLLIFLVVFLGAPLAEGSDLQTSNDQYQVTFDQDEIPVYEKPLEKSVYNTFTILEKKSGKKCRVRYDVSGCDDYSVNRLLLHLKYMTLFEFISFADRGTISCRFFDLQSGKETTVWNGEAESVEVSPDKKYFIFVNFPGVGMELGERLADQIELVSMTDQGWKHFYLNGRGNKHGHAIYAAKRPKGKKPQNYRVLSNFLWSKDNCKVYFIAGEDAYFKSDDMDAVVPAYGLVVLDLSKGAGSPQFIERSLDNSLVPSDSAQNYLNAYMRGELKWDKGKLFMRVFGNKGKDGKQEWKTSWIEEAVP
jgi:hypothetical protein